jgi:hypothetical protein
MKTDQIYDQLARTGLLPEGLSAAILAGDTPPLEDIVLNMLICSMDCHAMTECDVKSTWTERRIARQCLVIAFLTAILASQTKP